MAFLLVLVGRKESDHQPQRARGRVKGLAGGAMKGAGKNDRNGGESFSASQIKLSLFRHTFTAFQRLASRCRISGLSNYTLLTCPIIPSRRPLSLPALCIFLPHATHVLAGQ